MPAPLSHFLTSKQQFIAMVRKNGAGREGQSNGSDSQVRLP
jgi:hypothetical protein